MTHPPATAAAETVERRDLLDRLAAHHPLALRDALQQRGGQAMAVALRMLRNRAEAEAIVLELFVELWRDPSLAAADGLDAWLVDSARHKCAERVKSRRASARPCPRCGRACCCCGRSSDASVSSTWLTCRGRSSGDSWRLGRLRR